MNPPRRDEWRQPALSLALPLVGALSGVQPFEAEPMPLAQFRVEAWQAAGMEGLDRRAFCAFRERLDKCQLDAPDVTRGEEPAVHLAGLARSLGPARKILADLASSAKQGTRRGGTKPAVAEDRSPAPKPKGKALNALPTSAAQASVEMDDFVGIWTAPTGSEAMGMSQMCAEKLAQPTQHRRMANMLVSTAAPSSARMEDFGLAPPAASHPLSAVDRAVSDAQDFPKVEVVKPGIGIVKPGAERTIRDAIPGRRLHFRKRPPG